MDKLLHIRNYIINRLEFLDGLIGSDLGLIRGGDMV